MMPHGMIVAELAGALTAFRLTLGSHLEIERVVDGGVAGLISRLRDSAFTLADLAIVLRLALLGGGASPVDAVRGQMKLRDAPEVAAIISAAVMASLLPPWGEQPDKQGGGGDEPFTLGTAYQIAFAIGLKPREIDLLTPWEFGRCVRGWNQAHGGEEQPEAPRQDEMAALFAKYG